MAHGSRSRWTSPCGGIAAPASSLLPPTTSERLPAMDGPTRDERGRIIADKLAALGLSQRAFQQHTGIDRDTLVRAIDGDERVRESSLKRIETALANLDEEMSSERDGMPSEIAEIHVTDGGREIVVRGPVSDLRELEQSVARLIRQLDSRDQAS